VGKNIIMKIMIFAQLKNIQSKIDGEGDAEEEGDLDLLAVCQCQKLN
jgi:hypothetical protein